MLSMRRLGSFRGGGFFIPLCVNVGFRSGGSPRLRGFINRLDATRAWSRLVSSRL
jgi:hypothetical protein